jgi:hypothetical protein
MPQGPKSNRIYIIESHVYAPGPYPRPFCSSPLRCRASASRPTVCSGRKGWSTVTAVAVDPEGLYGNWFLWISCLNIFSLRVEWQLLLCSSACLVLKTIQQWKVSLHTVLSSTYVLLSIHFFVLFCPVPDILLGRRVLFVNRYFLKTSLAQIN